jgi:uncharacterized protein YjbI with pentapeptide repeats
VSVYIVITRADLVAADACASGLEDFDRIAPSGQLRCEWTQLHDAWLSMYRHCQWLRDIGAVPPAANLRWADLRRADLRRAYLSRADLSGADLRGAYLVGADLSRADLRGADLSRADLSRTDLRGAYLEGADLRGADLRGAYLDLRGADLRGAIRPIDPPDGWRPDAAGYLVRAT